jgi:DNA invertase Pin-like site-specific DNA recombinase
MIDVKQIPPHMLRQLCRTPEAASGGAWADARRDQVGLKGTMSEAQLHVLRARLRGGILNKARRGDLETPLPIGFVYDGAKRVVLDPDQQVQRTVRAFFETFRRTGSRRRRR